MADDDDDRTMLALVHDPITKTLSLETLPVPVPREPDEHLIQVHAVAITNGELDWPEPATVNPSIPGYEVSGTVVLAPKESAFQPGTEVYARTAFNRAGNAREYTIALTNELTQKPENLSWEEAATVPLSALTAWQALFVHGGLTLPDGPLSPPSPPPPLSASSSQSSHRPPTTLLQQQQQQQLQQLQQQLQQQRLEQQRPASRPSSSYNHRPRSIVGDDVNANKRVLVTAAAGGVGLWAVQLARLAGVGHITGTCGPANVDFVRSLGAHRVVDYTTARGGGGSSSTSGGPGSGPGGGGSSTASGGETSSGRNSPVPGGGSSSRPRSSSQSSRYGYHGSSDKYDLVVDCAGGEALRRAWTQARHGGTVISVAAPADKFRPDTGVGMDVKSVWFVVAADPVQLLAITNLIELGAVKAAFDSAFQLEQHGAAFAKAHSGHVRGKVVLRLA